MKTRIVSWARKEDNERVLLAIKLLEDENMVETYTFSKLAVTEDFEKQLRETWKRGDDILFPEHEKNTLKLSITEPILPEGVTLEDKDLVNRLRTEWNFVVLSKRLKNTFQEELSEMKDHAEQLTDFDSNLWNNLKEFWNKVQHQTREKNLFREHAENIKEETNELFSKLKDIRNKTNKEFAEESAKLKEVFHEKLNNIDDRVKKGLSLHPIFQELKDIQNKFKNAKMTRGDRDEIWDKLDGLFKEVKKLRFGGDAQKPGASSTDKIKRRLDGLYGAIERMQRSITRDEKELNYIQNKKESEQNQLENQLRAAKVDMIQQRIESKKVKMTDMKKTKEMLETRIKKLEAQQEKEKVKEELKDKIAQEIKEHHESVMDNPKVAKAIEEVRVENTQSEPKTTPSPANGSDGSASQHDDLLRILSDVASTAGQILS